MYSLKKYWNIETQRWDLLPKIECVEYLRNIKYFKRYSSQGLSEVLEYCRLVTFTEGKIIFKDAFSEEYVFILINGVIQVKDHSCAIGNFFFVD